MRFKSHIWLILCVGGMLLTNQSSAQVGLQLEPSLSYAGVGTSLRLGYDLNRFRCFAGMNYLHANHPKKSGFSTLIDFKPDSSTGKYFIRFDQFSFKNAQDNRLSIRQVYAGYGHVFKLGTHFDLNTGIGIGGYRERLTNNAEGYTINGVSYCISLGFGFWR